MTIDWPWELVPDGIHLHVGQQFRRVVPGQRVALLPTIGFLDIFLFVLQSLQNFEKIQKVEKRAITFQPLRLCSRRNRSAGYNDAQKLLRPLTTPLPKSVEWLWHWFAGLVSWKKKKVNGSANLRLSFPLVKAARGPKKKRKKCVTCCPGGEIDRRTGPDLATIWCGPFKWKKEIGRWTLEAATIDSHFFGWKISPKRFCFASGCWNGHVTSLPQDNRTQLVGGWGQRVNLLSSWQDATCTTRLCEPQVCVNFRICSGHD